MPGKVGFKVVQLSGQDENFKGSELQTHCPTAKGWQSSRCCLYPQDIIIQLEKRTRMRKIQILSHQHLIATKIEFYVGDVPDGYPVSLQNARYTRLGFVALSNNEKTSFRARELKSVHVDAVGHFVKFVIHKNHLNPSNLYNQVGLIAINVIGDDVQLTSDLQSMSLEENKANNSVLSRDRSDYISPFDDLAFDMYQDPEVAQVIRKLDSKKQDAVAHEQYDYAKKIKATMQQMAKVGERLGKFEIEKRQAVENEDYDRAKQKKSQMDEYRMQMYKQLEIEDLIEVSLPKLVPSDIEIVRVRTPSPPSRPAEATESEDTATVVPSSPFRHRHLAPHQAYDERPLPAMKRYLESVTDEEQGQLEEDVENTEPESMTENDVREAGSMTDIFGPRLTSKAYSKHWNLREEALSEIHQQMLVLEPLQNKDDARNIMRAALIAFNKSVKDNVFAVFCAALALHKMILLDFIPKHRITKGDTSYFLEKTIPNLLLKTGDVSARHRDAVKSLIVEESSFPEAKSLGSIIMECIRPFKSSTAPRLALSRTEIVDMLYQVHGLSASGLIVDNMMSFLTVALSHTSGDVRERAEKVIVSLYNNCGTVIKNYLPSDDDKTRKNLLYKQLFKEFDKIDASLTPEDLRRQRQEVEQQQAKEVVHSKMAKDEGRTPRAKDKRGGNLSPPKPTKDIPEGNETSLNLDSKCIFCEEVSVGFTPKGLDMHYWKTCPMLMRCSQCKQVVEISGWNDHLLEECENKAEFVRCQRCARTVRHKELSQHMAEKFCVPLEVNKVQCPLCHTNIPNGEDSWKSHLLGRDGCPQNQRRVQAGKASGIPKTTKGKVK